MGTRPEQFPVPHPRGPLHIPIPHEELVRSLAEAVSRAGGRGLVVGGCVRDALMGERPGDADLEVFGIPPAQLQQIAEQFARTHLVGRFFGVLKVGPLDVSIPRRRSPGGRAGFQASDPHMTLAEAARRRDFTVNALAWDPLDGTLYDPTGGVADLEAGLLRAVAPDTFVEDPVRALRAVRFAARFPLEPTPETRNLCRILAPRLQEAPRERIFGELKRLLLEGRRIGFGLDLAMHMGIVASLWPELEALKGCPQDPIWHPEGDVWTHTCLASDVAGKERTGLDADDLRVGLAVLFHDLGKPATTQVTPSGRIHTHGHERVGSKLAGQVMGRLTNEKDLIEDVCRLVHYHLAPTAFFQQRVPDRTIRKLSARVRIGLLARVARADLLGRTSDEARRGACPAVTWLLERAEALQVTDGRPRPILSGRHLLELGVEPGPTVGALLRDLYSRQLDGEFSDLASGLEVAKVLVRATTGKTPSQDN